jgi:hypothetical protein
MPIVASDAPYGAFNVVRQTLSDRVGAAALHLPELEHANSGTLSVTMPHRVEFLTLRDIRREEMPKSEKPDCWRFLVERTRDSDQKGGRPSSAFEPIAAVTATRVQDDRFVFGGINQGQFVRETVKAIVRAEEVIEDREEQYEAILLVIPPFCIVALWLRNRSRDNDLVIPIPPLNPALELGEWMTATAFLKALREGLSSQRAATIP